MAMRFGANDMGSTMIEENVVRSAGVAFRLDQKEIVSLITNLGFKAQKRDLYYNPVSG